MRVSLMVDAEEFLKLRIENAQLKLQLLNANHTIVSGELAGLEHDLSKVKQDNIDNSNKE